MTTLSVRLDDDLNREFDLLCRKDGYKKGGLVVRLIREFIENKKSIHPSATLKTVASLEGKLSLGGNALDDTEQVFHE